MVGRIDCGRGERGDVGDTNNGNRQSPFSIRLVYEYPALALGAGAGTYHEQRLDWCFSHGWERTASSGRAESIQGTTLNGDGGVYLT